MAKAAAKTVPTTRYVVFVADGRGWTEVGRLAARGGRAAINKVRDGVDGTYVATPERSWNPLTFTTEMRPRVVVTEVHPEQTNLVVDEPAEAAVEPEPVDG